MKSFRKFTPAGKWRIAASAVLLASAGFALTASANLPGWIRSMEAKSGLERAFFRAMELPYGEVLFRRPPAETRPALGELMQQQPSDADLHSLRALEDEHHLDFAAAERDWKLYAEKAKDKTAAEWDLADFYHRRLRPQDEIATLRAIGDSPSPASERLTAANRQNSWQAFERILRVIQDQAAGKESTLATYRAWIARYPSDEGLYARFLEYLVAQQEFEAATRLIASYQKAFPGDEVFPMKAKALVEYKHGSFQQGLAIYEKNFQPLWKPELVKAYFDLLRQTQGLRKFLDEARRALSKNPQDLNATAHVFYYYQQQGKLQSAQQAITDLSLRKEAANSAWKPEELYVCGRLLEEIHSYPEAARYYFALYNSKGADDSQERALSRLTDILLTAPESPVRFGSGELTMYKDIATMDQGPGYFNGILSLLLSSTEPQSSYHEEEQRGVAYFHRSRAALLLALLDKSFPGAASRPQLHAKLLEFYANNGQSEAVLQGGQAFLAAFPKAPERTQVALLVADAYERLKRPQDEFASYDAVLEELAAQAERMPLGGVAGGTDAHSDRLAQASERSSPDADQDYEPANTNRQGAPAGNGAFEVVRNLAEQTGGPRSPEYSRVLERYLARLVQLNQIPQALGVLRREIDHNPDDPGLYQRLAGFLQQNNLTQQEEDVYRRAFARFSDPGWYHQLARLYLRYRRLSELEQLTRQAVNQFKGSVLEGYFASADGGSELSLRLNLYANARFPHDLYFVHNLLLAYHVRPTYDDAAWLALIRQHWFEDATLRSQYFEYLSSHNLLEGELSALRRERAGPGAGNWSEAARKNPAAVTEIADAELWSSHFEESAPALQALAELYPTERQLDRTASSVLRSLAYFDPSKTAVAAKIEDNLLAANPGDTEILARIGDIYADRELFVQAAPYWERIPKVAPGQSSGYLDAATIYWDYFDFKNALRLLEEGRKQLGNPALYGYEEGAIYETERDYPRAIEEYASAALASGVESPAASRLLQLARRPTFHDLIHDATAKIAVDRNYSSAAVNLRLRVLEAQNGKPEMTDLLTSALDHATTIEQAAEIESIAQQQSIELIRQRALEKQAALAADPVTRMQLRYALVRFYEGKKDLASAQRNIEALYQANPKILGVVRSTVDFYWRAKMYPQAIAVLRQAAKDSYPQLSSQFTFEAARKSTEIKDVQQARTLLEALLKESRYDSQYLAAMADTYARLGDVQGLKQFYLDQLALFKNAPFAPDERKNRVATLRRGLIPALTQLQEYSGGVDQYVELLNNFPEDEALSTEAALYAHRYQREGQLLDFYRKTVQQSPRDYRWAMVLARIETALEDFSAAIDSYGKSITIRPDRTDLQIARANLEQRLLRFDDALKDYERLYQLTYKDPKYMEKIAEVRARQGRNADAVSALTTALIDTAPERPGKYFEAARRLEAWNILEPARNFAELGVASAGDELLASVENHEGARLYARVLTRLRQSDKAYARLQEARNAASNSLPVLEQQVAKQGIAAISDKQWRDHVLETRRQNAHAGMRAALTEMGSTVARYYTPEEKVEFTGFAETLRSGMSGPDALDLAVPLVTAAELADLEAKWRFAWLMNASSIRADYWGQFAAFVQLERRRLKFSELGGQLERLAQHVQRDFYVNVMTNAAQAYAAGGDTDDELRLLAKIGPSNLGGDNLTRLFALSLKRNPQQLVQYAAQWTTWGQAAADYALVNGGPEFAHAVVAARGQTRPPVWTQSYTALAGLYLAENQPQVNSAFLSALGDGTIGDRIGKKGNRADQLAGDVWFYYGSRYGEYLRYTKQGTPEDFLPSELEHSPASVDGYMTLGDFYLDQSEPRKAIQQYQYVSDLSPGRIEVHDKLAMAYIKDQNRAEAVAEWKRFFAAELALINSGRLPETFWADFGRACDHVRARGVSADVNSEIEQLVRAYLRRNGNYRSNAVLHSAYLTQADPAAASEWLIKLSEAASDPATVRGDMADAKWIPQANRGPLYERVLDAKRAALAKAEGLEQENAKAELWNWQIRWLGYLLESKQFTPAAELILALRKSASAIESATLVPYEIQCAAKLATLDAILSGYKAAPETAPVAESLRNAARQLADHGDHRSARKVLEFVFARQLEEHQSDAPSFLGLAEIRLADGDSAGAVALLKRMVLTVGDQYQNMDSAAALLEKANHPAQALSFLEPLAEATPWDNSFHLRLAKAQLAANQEKAAGADTLATIAASGAAPYAVRVQAASALTSLGQPRDLGSQELKLLAAGDASIAPADADHPFFYDARLAAAQKVSSREERLHLLSNALADQPSRSDARVPFFRAAASLKRDELALASIEQMLQAGVVDRRFEETTADEDVLRETDGSDSGGEAPPGAALPTQRPLERAQLAHEVGTVMTRLERWQQAQAYLKAAQNLEKSPAELKRLSAELGDVRTRLRRQRENAARRPIFHEALEQDRLVRPQILVRAATKPAVKTGGKP